MKRKTIGILAVAVALAVVAVAFYTFDVSADDEVVVIDEVEFGNWKQEVYIHQESGDTLLSVLFGDEDEEIISISYTLSAEAMTVSGEVDAISIDLSGFSVQSTVGETDTYLFEFDETPYTIFVDAGYIELTDPEFFDIPIETFLDESAFDEGTEYPLVFTPQGTMTWDMGDGAQSATLPSVVTTTIKMSEAPPPPPGAQVFTVEEGYIFSDGEPGTILEVSPDGTAITATDINRNSVVYTYKEFTIDYFTGDFIHEFQVDIVASDVAGLVCLWAVTNGEAYVFSDITSGYGVYYFQMAGPVDKIFLKNFETGDTVAYDSTGEQPYWEIPATFYFRFYRDTVENTLTLDIFSDFARENLIVSIGGQFLTCDGTTSYSHFFPMMSKNDDNYGDKYTTLSVSDVVFVSE